MPLSSSTPPADASVRLPPIDWGVNVDVPLHRIDAAHPPQTIVSPVASSSVASMLAGSDDPSTQDNDESIGFDPQAIRQAHEEDLIAHLQRWSEDIDQRATRLHSDMATHERRERAFRLWMQNRRAELDSQILDYRTAKLQVEAIARRLAITQG